tara:strand:- start:2008 stop:3642 length:1635 start_codon:yes stop_codon:yes gene_type:complete
MEELIVKIENAGAAAGANSQNQPSKDAPVPPKSFFNQMGGAVQGGMKKAGIQFGVGALLKQSQLFTGFLGSIFQIVGGMIDLMLAPLMPIFIPVLKFLAKMMPGVRITATAIANKLIEIGTSITGWWKENAPSWLQGGDGTQIAQVAGGVFTALMFAKFTGLWKFGKWFLNIKVGQEALEAGVKGAAKTAAKEGAKTIGGSIKSGIWRFIKYLGSGFKALMFKIPGVQSLVGLATKTSIMLKSFKDTVITTLYVWMDDSIKFFKSAATDIGRHFLTGTREMVKSIWAKFTGPLSKLTGPLGILKTKIMDFLPKITGPFAALKEKIMGFLKGPISKVGDLGNFLQKRINSIWTFIKGAPQALIERVGKVIQAVMKKPFEIIQKIADKFPGLGKLAKGITGIFTKGGAVSKIIGAGKGAVGKSVAKIGGKAGLQAAGMSIPIFGSAIGLAAGIYETQRMGRKYGWNAKTIGAGLAYTAVQTGAGFAGTGVGIAAAIAGEVALNQFENRVLKVEMVGADQQTQLSMRNKNAADQAIDISRMASDYQN